MRLIDADALIDWIRNDSGDKLMDSLYIDHINEMPTSYDVEKVVVSCKICPTVFLCSTSVITNKAYQMG